MKNLILTSSIAMISMAAKADVIKCTFTEPFVSSTYSMTQSTLTYKNHSEGTTSVIKNVSFQIRGAGKFELVSRTGKVLQTLLLNYRGSDGMSDNRYPYAVKDSSMDHNANNGLGGCSSNYLRTVIVN